MASRLTASESENADLFWGTRGGGGNFGVVTEFEFELHPIGPTVLGGMLMYPAPMAGAVLRHFRDFIAEAPDEVCGGLRADLRAARGVRPEPVRGQPVLRHRPLLRGAARGGRGGPAAAARVRPTRHGHGRSRCHTWRSSSSSTLRTSPAGATTGPRTSSPSSRRGDRRALRAPSREAVAAQPDPRAPRRRRDLTRRRTMRWPSASGMPRSTSTSSRCGSIRPTTTPTSPGRASSAPG